MIALDIFEGKKIALFGLGASGLSTAIALAASGAQLICFDDKEENCEKARNFGLTIKNLRDIFWEDLSFLVLSPGIALTYPEPHWVVKCAKKYSIEIIGDIELFCRARRAFLKRNDFSDKDCPFIAITGTNGKSTTTNLTAHLLRAAGFDVCVGGNIGVPILSLADFCKGRHYVIECSSFQIDLTPSIDATAAALLNLTPDHIDRHGSFSAYCAAKERLIAQSNCAFVSVDDLASLSIASRQEACIPKMFFIGKEEQAKTDYFSHNQKLFHREEEQREFLVDLSQSQHLKGPHNIQNSLFSLAIARFFRKDFSYQEAFDHYENLPHRMQFVGQKGKIIFINDSKATNAEAVAPALEAFSNIYWIAGGVAKAGGIEILKGLFPKVQKAYLIGEASLDFSETLEGKVSYNLCENLEDAVNRAVMDSQKQDKEAVILLSPACASYDQFSNYEQRGEAFIRYARSFL